MSDLVSDGGIFPCGRKYIPNRLDKRGVVIKLNYCGRGGVHKKVGSLKCTHPPTSRPAGLRRTGSGRGIEQKLRLEREAQSQKRREIDGENG